MCRKAGYSNRQREQKGRIKDNEKGRPLDKQDE